MGLSKRTSPLKERSRRDERESVREMESKPVGLNMLGSMAAMRATMRDFVRFK